MRKLFLTTGLLSILAMPAMAETKLFLGMNVGFAGPVFSDDVEDSIDDDILKSDGGTITWSGAFGLRFGEHNSVYNGGVSATLSYMPQVGHLTDGPNFILEDYYGTYRVNIDGKIDLTTLYFTYDNYIRLSGDEGRRLDFVISFGLGHAWVNESMTIYGYGKDTMSDNGAVGVLKFGLNGETAVEGLGWNVSLNFIGLNADDDFDLQGAYSIDFGLRYTF